MGRHEFVNPLRLQVPTSLKLGASSRIQELASTRRERALNAVNRLHCGEIMAAAFIAHSSATRALAGAPPRLFKLGALVTIQCLGRAARATFGGARLCECMLGRLIVARRPGIAFAAQFETLAGERPVHELLQEGVDE